MNSSRAVTTCCCAVCSVHDSPMPSAASRRCAPTSPANCFPLSPTPAGSSTPSCWSSPNGSACGSTKCPSTGSTTRTRGSTSCRPRSTTSRDAGDSGAHSQLARCRFTNYGTDSAAGPSPLNRERAQNARKPRCAACKLPLARGEVPQHARGVKAHARGVNSHYYRKVMSFSPAGAFQTRRISLISPDMPFSVDRCASRSRSASDRCTVRSGVSHNSTV